MLDRLDKSKQKMVLNAGFEEFAANGFEHGSTNEIVRRAGIGKGTLFYYFKTKQEFYFCLIDYGLELVKHKFLALVNTQERDLFKRLINIAEIKLQFLQKYPEVMNFLASVIFNDFPTLNEELKRKYRSLQELGDEKTYKNIDLSLFRDNVDPEKAFKIIQWAFDGYEQELKMKLRHVKISSIDYDAYRKEFYDYLAVIKAGFYK